MTAIAANSHDPLLSVEQTAEYLGVSAYTVRQWARERRILLQHCATRLPRNPRKH